IDQGWQQTRGQQSCPTGAMRAIKVEDEEMARLAQEQNLEVMKPELGTKPRVYYRNLYRYAKCFIGGSVAEEKNGAVDCLEGASVQLIKDGVCVAVTTTDNYGDFKFDKLDENSGRYSVQIFASGRSKTLEANLGASINLGEIKL
ncbi:MAG TPA: oxidoreductase, partial [Xanthobacteraceae bacterium]|nr:oxidoreductase [Xanthobacteraceae bacterium]